MLTTQDFCQHLTSLTPTKKFCLAFSGGLDSTVLLHLLTAYKQSHLGISFRAIHINHGLSINADQWEQTCQKACATLHIPFESKRIQIHKGAQESLEALAREQRYRVLQELIKEDEVLLTAHHQNDQAETLLLQLFRGCGPNGLAAMPEISGFGKSRLLRPLLSYSKEAITSFAMQHNLVWLDDESNQNTNFDRNFIRHELMPLIKKHWPGVVSNIARTTRHCAAAKQFITENIQKIYDEIYDAATKSLVIGPLLQHDTVTQTYVIRHWLQQQQYSVPNTKKLMTIIKQLHCPPDAMPLIHWKDVEVRRYNQFLYALPNLKSHDASTVIPWDLTTDLHLPCGTILSTVNLTAQGLELSNLANVTIRFRQGGERCKLINRNHTHALKKLLQDWRVPPWMRDRIPLLYSDNELKAVIGYAICQ